MILVPFCRENFSAFYRNQLFLVWSTLLKSRNLSTDYPILFKFSQLVNLICCPSNRRARISGELGFLLSVWWMNIFQTLFNLYSTKWSSKRSWNQYFNGPSHSPYHNKSLKTQHPSLSKRYFRILCCITRPEFCKPNYFLKVKNVKFQKR